MYIVNSNQQKYTNRSFHENIIFESRTYITNKILSGFQLPKKLLYMKEF